MLIGGIADRRRERERAAVRTSFTHGDYRA
jgi:hypothetical protein